MLGLGAAIALGLSPNPYRRVEEWLTRGGEVERKQPVFQDPLSIDVLHGEDLARSLTDRMASDNKPAVLFMGNSQQYTCSLPRGAKIDEGHRAMLMSDLVARELARRSGRPLSVYNASAPSQTLVEKLWQGIFWFVANPTPPRVLVIQSSFDMYRKTGVRAGFRTLLREKSFQSALEAWPCKERAYCSEFSAALEGGAAQDKTAVSEGLSLSNVEGAVRSGLEWIPQYHYREERKASFLNSLYLLRVSGLRVSPTSRRHITGQPLEANTAALEDLVALALKSGARVFIYNAPINPAVSMFYESEYQEYLTRLRALAHREKVSFVDLAGAVPADQWGYWIDGPDPIHIAETGHRTLATALVDSFGEELLASSTP
jgi:hypothetical protein